MRLIPTVIFVTGLAGAAKDDHGPSPIKRNLLGNTVLYSVFCKPNASYDCYFVQENCPNCNNIHPVELRGQKWDEVIGKTFHKWCNPKSGPPGQQSGCFYVDSDCDESLSYTEKINQCVAVPTRTINVVFENIGRGHGGNRRLLRG